MSAFASGMILLIALSLIGCSSPRPDVACMQEALKQDGLTDGEVVFRGVDGNAVHVSEGWNLFRKSSVLPMASLTKLLVAEQIRIREERGNFSMDASVASILHRQGLNPRAAGLTLRQLVQHQGGLDRTLQDPLFAGGDPDCEFAASVVLARPPERSPGEAIIYSNAGYCVLGEVLKLDSVGLPSDVDSALRSPLGAAGGWQSSLPDAYVALSRLLPVHPLSSKLTLADGSYYAYAWRHWSRPGYPQWTHFGRLPGILSIAATDGQAQLLVAFFRGDPSDVEWAAERAAKDLWKCAPIGGL